MFWKLGMFQDPVPVPVPPYQIQEKKEDPFPGRIQNLWIRRIFSGNIRYLHIFDGLVTLNF